MVLEVAVEQLNFLGRYDKALALQEYLLWREPLNVIIRYNLILRYLDAQRFEDALLLTQALLEERPEDQFLIERVTLGKRLTGDVQGALADADRVEDPIIRLAARATAYYMLGHQEESKAAIAELAELTESIPQARDVLASVYAEVGDADAAFETLDRMVEDGTIKRMRNNEPNYLKLHKDPRWALLMESLGSTKAQFDAIDFDVDIPSRSPSR